MLRTVYIFIISLFVMVASSTLLQAKEVPTEIIVAVASNFTEPAKEIAKLFEEQTNNKVELAFGATGSFYNQIKNGAPFEVFLAADDERPTKIMQEGYGVENSQFTYAIGTLVLWSSKDNYIQGADILQDPNINHIAFSNAEAAPYGKAALETMQAMNIYDNVAAKLVEGKNISQTFQYVKTGNAEIGFVALSQIINEKQGSQWLVPQEYYSPIKQDAVLLKTGAENEAAKAFIDFLKSDEAAKIINKYGYKMAN